MIPEAFLCWSKAINFVQHHLFEFFYGINELRWLSYGSLGVESAWLQLVFINVRRTPTAFHEIRGGEADSEAAYNLCLILKTMLWKLCHKTLFATAFIYIWNVCKRMCICCTLMCICCISCVFLVSQVYLLNFLCVFVVLCVLLFLL
jgi:hypothetical protein